MKFSSLSVLAVLLGLTSASPHDPPNDVRFLRHKRQVPQEHSHDFVLTITREFLNLNNPKQIVDAVFGLLGNAAAANGAGTVTNLDCLKQETADQAFTNAKAVADLRGMSAALLFQAIERNTGGVGVKSVLCTEKAVNPEIAALTQHQDPASENAGALNKAITLELAKQLAGIGADPLLALLSGTFAPGNPNDATGRGNSCDQEEPELGCIFSQGLLVLDASEQEVSSAVAGVSQTFTGTGGIFATDLVDLGSFSVASVTGTVDLATIVNGAGGAARATNAATNAATAAATTAAKATTAAAAPANTAPANNNDSAADNEECIVDPPVTSAAAGSSCSVITTTILASQANTLVTRTTAQPATGTNAAAAGKNIQAFTGTLGGPAPPVISSTGPRPFSVNGNTFTGSGAAISRSCDIQHNACANAANSGQLAGGVGQCETQVAQCKAANNLRRRQQTGGGFGSCTDPSIVFAVGLDGRKEGAFAPANKADFNHGSAQRIGIIADFICQRLGDSCRAGADVVASCTQAATAAKAATQDQTAADLFNSKIGVAAGSANGGNGGNRSGNGNGNGNGNGKAAVTTSAAARSGGATAVAASVVMTITQCS